MSMVRVIDAVTDKPPIRQFHSFANEGPLAAVG